MKASAAGMKTKGRRARLHLTHLGAGGWIITDGQTTVLMDPYLSRLRFRGRPFGAPDAGTGPGDRRPLVSMDEVPVCDTATIDARIPRADFILLSHSHFNHCMDMPYIARKTGATVIGTETTGAVARAGGVPEGQILTVRGGEDYEFGRLSLRVVPSLHSALDAKHYFDPGTISRGHASPLRLCDYVEGGTLAYLIRLAGHQVLIFGSMNYIEREVAGLRPGIVLVAADRPRLEIHDYTGRLLRALGRPRVVIATHWDDQGLAFGMNQDAALAQTRSFVAEVKAVGPRSQVVVPRHFETVVVERSGRVSAAPRREK
jgi:L-ascorbate metabolism protein UlaG (beta-lactamase superfamily)